jgi:hypothetical protein
MGMPVGGDGGRFCGGIIIVAEGAGAVGPVSPIACPNGAVVICAKTSPETKLKAKVAFL